MLNSDVWIGGREDEIQWTTKLHVMWTRIRTIEAHLSKTVLFFYWKKKEKRKWIGMYDSLVYPFTTQGPRPIYQLAWLARLKASPTTRHVTSPREQKTVDDFVEENWILGNYFTPTVFVFPFLFFFLGLILVQQVPSVHYISWCWRYWTLEQHQCRRQELILVWATLKKTSAEVSKFFKKIVFFFNLNFRFLKKKFKKLFF